MKYLLIGMFDNTSKIKTEKDLRDIYYEHIKDIIYDWKDCKDIDIINSLEEEKNQVYTCNIQKVINVLEDDNWYYTIIKLREEV